MRLVPMVDDRDIVTVEERSMASDDDSIQAGFAYLQSVFAS